MLTIILLVTLSIVAYLVALGIVRFAIQFAVGAETARTPNVVAACMISAAILVFTVTYFVVAYLVHGRTIG